MKFKAIERICKSKKRVCIVNRRGADGNVEQWVGDALALYPLWDAPIVEVEQLLGLFDVPESNRDKWVAKEMPAPESLCFEDTEEGEQQVEPYKIGLSINGTDTILFNTEDGLAAIDRKYLAPIKDSNTTIYAYKRISAKGNPYFAIKEGMLLKALIMPMDIAKADTADELTEMAKQMRVAAIIKGRKDYDPGLDEAEGEYGQEEI